MNMRKTLLLILLSFTSHTLMAQCAGPGYVAPSPSVACSCLFAWCSGGGVQTSGGNIGCAYDYTSGGIDCTYNLYGFIGESYSCSASIHYWPLVACASESGLSIGTCITAPWSCILTWGSIAATTELSSGPSSPTCVICGNIVTCSTVDNGGVIGSVQNGSWGACPPPGNG